MSRTLEELKDNLRATVEAEKDGRNVPISYDLFKEMRDYILELEPQEEDTERTKRKRDAEFMRRTDLRMRSRRVNKEVTG